MGSRIQTSRVNTGDTGWGSAGYRKLLVKLFWYHKLVQHGQNEGLQPSEVDTEQQKQ